jgi:hypothetical protein
MNIPTLKIASSPSAEAESVSTNTAKYIDALGRLDALGCERPDIVPTQLATSLRWLH